MVHLILFTVGVLCLLFWGGAIIGALVGLAAIAFQILAFLVSAIVGTVSMLLWCIWWCYDKPAAMAEWHRATASKALARRAVQSGKRAA